MTEENDIRVVVPAPEQIPGSPYDGWQWSNHGEEAHHVVVSLIDDGSVEIEHVVDGRLVHTYMRHPEPERLDPDPERLNRLRGVAAVVQTDPMFSVPAAHYKADVTWLLHELDKAVARDRQPYPTRQAYERTAECLAFYRTKVERVRELLDSTTVERPSLSPSQVRVALDRDGIYPPASKDSTSTAEG